MPLCPGVAGGVAMGGVAMGGVAMGGVAMGGVARELACVGLVDGCLAVKGL